MEAVTAAMSIDAPTREGSRLTLRTSHTTINGGRVVRRSFIPRCELGARGYKDGYPVLGYPRGLGQGWSNHAAPRRQYVVCWGAGRRRHADRSRLRQRRPPTKPNALVRRGAP